MYEEFSQFFECPPDEQMVWRYMRLSRFLWMLKESKLYFSRPAEFKDPYEGTIPFACTSKIPEELKAAYGLQRKLAAISCWHMNDVESIAMWKLYVDGPDGVTIQSRIGALKRMGEHSPFVIGKVRYMDYQIAPQQQFVDPLCALQAYLPIFQKRKGYEHEQEVRIVILNPMDLPGQRLIPAERNPGDTGFGLPVLLSDLIDKIVVSPGYPTECIAALQQDVDATDLKIRVEKSQLLNPPNKQCEEVLRGKIRRAT
jgi:hypothetical protein